MQALPEQIISHGYTPQRVWDELAQRSRETGITVVLQCPVCDAEIHPTDTTHLQCLSCDAPVEVYQHREHTETADTRLIYIQANGQRRAVLRLNLQCLSCELPLQRDETCNKTCKIQTYLVLAVQDGELYIKRAANLPRVPRDTPETEIDTRTLPDTSIAAFANDTPRTYHPPVNPPQAMDFDVPEHPHRHTDVARQILTYLSEHGHTATTAELLSACDCSREALNKALQKLITAGDVEKVSRGVYELINP